jgi:hypothetical protein
MWGFFGFKLLKGNSNDAWGTEPTSRQPKPADTEDRSFAIITVQQPVTTIIESMSSPTLDLDMNLDSPSWNDTSGMSSSSAVGGGTRSVQLKSSTNAAGKSNVKDDAPNDVNTANASALSTLSFEVDATVTNDISGLEEPKPPGRNLNEMMELVETWREEVNMMSVKNAILLDDLVKIGADI